MRGRQPRLVSLLESSSLRGVPSGFEGSVTTLPEKPTTRAINFANSRMLTSLPEPTFTCESPGIVRHQPNKRIRRIVHVQELASRRA